MQRADELFRAHQQSIFHRTDRLFAALLACEWVAGVGVALWISPRTWEGLSSQTHPHVWQALTLGGLAVILPILLAIIQPGKLLTRHVIAVGQMVYVGILIHLTGGRIETHFLIFGSLAFLAFYRDWPVLISASVVVAADHLLRELWWPESIYGIASTTGWRWVEHAWWVVFENAFLIVACRQGVTEMWNIAVQRATLELDQFGKAVHEVGTAADYVASASKKFTEAAQSLSTGTQEQASALEETVASLEEIVTSIKQNADNAQQANQLSLAARDIADKGGQVVGSAVTAMSEINHASQRIADIITTIDEIAFQTNLLALNAAVEAARAGEQGRGFAVVATEVRSLSQRSATAAKEIKALIQDSGRKVEAGSDLVNKSGQTLGEIVIAVRQVTELIAQIASTSREQTTGINQVFRAASQMDAVVQRNAAQGGELSSTAQNLADQAQELLVLVGHVRVSTEKPVGTSLDDDGQSPTSSYNGHAAEPQPAKVASRAYAKNTGKSPVEGAGKRLDDRRDIRSHRNNGYEEF